MPVILDYMSGNCRIRVNDDYVVKTEEEEQKILDNIARIYVKYQIESTKEASEK